MPGGEPPKRPTPPSGTPVQARPPTPTGDIPSTPRPTSSQGIPRPATPPAQRTPPPEIIQPPTVRYGAAQSSSTMKQVSNEDAEVQHAMSLLSSNDWTGARLAFHALAAKQPQARQYRALLCYARGRETQATGRPDDAAMEFQRALQLDPDLELAKVALRELGRKSRW
jgi:hypothetical protein